MTGMWTTTQDGPLRHKHAQEIGTYLKIARAVSRSMRATQNAGAEDSYSQ